MIKIYVMNENRFEHIDLLGKSPRTLLEDSLEGKFERIDSITEVITEGSDYVAVLYTDTPLADYTFIEELSKKGNGFRLGDGYIKKSCYKGSLAETNDIRSKQIISLSDVGPIYNELRRRVRKSFDGRDILFYDIESCHIDLTVKIGDGAIIHPMVSLRGNTVIGEKTVVFSQCELIDTVIDDNVDIRSTYSLGAKIGSHTTVGPFACLRKGAVVGAYCRVGDFVEVKNSTIGDGTKMAHLAYVGDSTVGQNTNVGCGTVFANYNGRIKQKCTVGSNVFIGANTNLIAPVVVNDGAYIAAGSTVTHDVPGGNLCIARSRQVLKENWERK